MESKIKVALYARVSTEEQKNHLTETDLDEYNDFDYIVENGENLEEKITKILSEVQYE